MLTKSDLQAIKEIVDERLDSKLEEKFDKKLKPVKRDLKRLRTDVSYLIKTTDENDVLLHRRVSKIEKHLDLESSKN